jgi:putative (di)nucleoside polyphosphate hydrolase
MLRQGNVIMPRSPAEKRSLIPRRTRQPRQERGESASAHRTHSHSELSIDRDPDLIMLLSDPEVRLMMHADNVKESQLREMLEAVSVQIQTSRAAHDATYRPGVGIVLLNTGNQVFVGRRIDVADAWQMPQGGIEPGETPQEAALRELREEIGTNDVEILAESSRWFYYDVPEDFARKAWNGRWRGQRQKWMVMLFKGQDSAIDVATPNPEFDAWRWVQPPELSTLAVSFKRRLYLSVLAEFPTIFRD